VACFSSAVLIQTINVNTRVGNGRGQIRFLANARLASRARARVHVKATFPGGEQRWAEGFFSAKCNLSYSHRGNAHSPVWVHRHIEAEAARHDERIRPILLGQDLPALNESLKSKGQQPIEVPSAKLAVTEDGSSPGG
jgi:hypothetical protein